MAALPKLIRVGHEEYRISRTNTLSEDNDGDFRRHEGEIRVRTGLSAHYERTVAFHEALHAVMNRSGLSDRLGHEEEEAVVSVLGEWLTDFLRDNPAFVRYLMTKDKV